MACRLLSLTKSCLLITIVCLDIQQVHSWSHPHTRTSVQSFESDRTDEVSPATSTSTSTSTSTPTTRRNVLHRASFTLLTGITLSTTTPLTSPALAETTPSKKDLARLQLGHARVRYLLENWGPLTEICGKGVMSDVERKQTVRTQGGGGGACEKTPLRVQDFLGYKSTEDPLFKADKLMLKAAPLVDVDDFEDYLGAVENYREKADQGSMMAYTSSWGEANPNGGKDMIDEYLERTKDEVVATEKLLRKILGYLNLEVLPPSSAAK